MPSVAEFSYQVNIFQLLYPCMNISWTSSIYLTILLSFERFLGICYPNLAREFCTLKKTMIYIIATFTFSCVYNIPRFLEYELTDVLARSYYDPGGFHLQLFSWKLFEFSIDKIWLRPLTVLDLYHLYLLTFWKIKFEKSSSTNWIFSLFEQDFYYLCSVQKSILKLIFVG